MKKLYLLIIGYLIATQLHAQQWDWASTLGPHDDKDRNTDLVMRRDGNLVTIGYTAPSSETYSEGYITAFTASGSQLWTRLLQATGQYSLMNLSSVTTDSDNNTYICGYYNDGIDFGDTVLTTTGNVDFFIAKYDAAGNLLNVWQGGGPGPDFCNAICIDEHNNIYVTGFYSSGSVFMGDTLTHPPASTQDLFLYRLSPAGNLTASITLQVDSFTWSNGTAEGTAIHVNRQGEVLLAARFVGKFTYGTLHMEDNSLYGTNLIIRLDNTLQPILAIDILYDTGMITDLGSDSQGNIFALANMGWTTGMRGYILKYTPGGTLSWSKEFEGGTPYAQGKLYGLYVDEDDNFIFGGYDQPGNVPMMIFEKYDASDNLVWKDTTIKYNGLITGITGDLSGNIYISGNFSDSMQLGAHYLAAPNEVSTFIASYRFPFLSVAHASEENGICLFPNPATSFVTAELKGMNANERIFVRDITGRLVREYKAHTGKCTLDLTGLEKGIYFVTTETGKRKSSKLVIQ